MKRHVAIPKLSAFASRWLTILEARRLRWGAAVVLALVALGPRSMAVVFLDGEFATGWEYPQVTTGNGGSWSAYPVSGAGNPGAYAVTLTTVSDNSAAIYGFGFNTAIAASVAYGVTT